MKLEEITAEIRPRTQWESVDLGVTLTRQHFPKLAIIWFLTVTPIWALLAFLLQDSPFWFLCAVVFLRPLYDRPILFYLSRALFNAPPRVRDILIGYPKIVSKGLLYGMTLGRFSLCRSLLLPLHILEGAKGRLYRSRRGAILRSGGGTGSYLTCVCLALELVIVMGMILLLISLVPSHLAPDWNEMYLRFFSFAGIGGGLPPALAWFALLVFLIAMTFVEIFYVGCGFTLYLNSRSQVEGWDIEITFRRLASRVRAATAPSSSTIAGILAAMFLSWWVLVPSAPAQDRVNDPLRSEIREVKERPEFDIVIKKIKVPEDVGDYNFREPRNLSWLVAIGEILFWAVIAGAVVALGIVLYLNRDLFSRKGGGGDEEARAKTRTVMGMDITREGLPDDIPAAALAAWRNGDPQLATSLLYRGSICWLVERARLPLEDSDTESDCLRHSQQLGDPPRQQYFSELTSSWILTAYNDQPPGEAIIVEFCESFPFDMRRAQA